MKNNQHANKFIVFAVFLFSLIVTLGVGSSPVLAQTVSDLGTNIGQSISTMGTLAGGGAFILAAIFGAIGVVKLKGHVEEVLAAVAELQANSWPIIS